jgi:hypothetical protein
LTGNQRSILQRQIANPRLDYLHRKALHKKLVTLSKGINVCSNCGFSNGKTAHLELQLICISGVVKKAVGSVLKIVHAEPITNENEYTSKDNNELNNLLGNVKFTLLDPLRVLNLFNKIKSSVSRVRYFKANLNF